MIISVVLEHHFSLFLLDLSHQLSFPYLPLYLSLCVGFDICKLFVGIISYLWWSCLLPDRIYICFCRTLGGTARLTRTVLKFIQVIWIWVNSTPEFNFWVTVTLTVRLMGLPTYCKESFHLWWSMGLHFLSPHLLNRQTRHFTSQESEGRRLRVNMCYLLSVWT